MNFTTQDTHTQAAQMGGASDNGERAQRTVITFSSVTLHSFKIGEREELGDIPRRIAQWRGPGAASLAALALTTKNTAQQAYMIECIVAFIFDDADFTFEWSPISGEVDGDFKTWFAIAAQRHFGGVFSDDILTALANVEWSRQFANPFVGVCTTTGLQIHQLANYFDGLVKGFSVPIGLTRGQRKVIRANTVRWIALRVGVSAETAAGIIFDENKCELAEEESEPIVPQYGGEFIHAFFNNDDDGAEVDGHSVVDTMRMFMERILPRVHHVHEHSFKMDPLSGVAKEFAKFFMEPGRLRLRLALNICGLVAAVTGYHKSAAAILYVKTLIAVYEGDTFDATVGGIAAFANFLASDLNPHNEVAPQALGDFASAGLVTRIFASIFEGASSLSIDKIVERFEKKMATFQRVHAGTQEFIQTATHLVTQFFSWLASKTGLEWLKLETQDPFWEISEYLDRVDEVRSEYNRNPQAGPEFDSKLRLLQDEGKRIYASLSGKSAGVTQAQANRVSQALRQVTDIRFKLSQSLNANSAMKPVPVTLVLTGAPGIGKTVFTHLMWPRLLPSVMNKKQLRQALKSKNIASYVYPLNPSDQYMSGYNGQVACLIDELGAAKDSLNASNIWLELIRLINMAPTSLNMADLDNKGKQFFTSRFIICTSNLKHFGRSIVEASVREPQAIHRRLEHTFIVGLKEEFRTANSKNAASPFDWLPDKEKMGQLANGDAKISWDHIMLYRMTDLETGAYDDKPISPDEAIKELATAAKKAEADRDRIVKAQRAALFDEAKLMGLVQEDDIDEDLANELLAAAEGSDDEDETPGSFEAEPANVEPDDDSQTEKPQRVKEVESSWMSPTRVALTVGAVTAVVGLGLKLFIRLCPERTATQTYGPRNKQHKLDLSAKRERTAVQSGGLANRQTAEFLANRNLYEVSIRATGADGQTVELRQGQALAVQNGVVMVPDHFIAQWYNVTESLECGHRDPDAVVVFKSKLRENKTGGVFAPVVVEASARLLSQTGRAVEVSPGDGADLVAIFVRGLSARKIVDRIKDASKMKAGEATEGYRLMLQYSNLTIERLRFERKDGGKMTDTTKNLIANSYVFYGAKCASGDCGAPIIDAHDDQVVGIHVAGTSSSGYAPVIDVSKLKGAIKYLCEVAEAPEDIGFQAIAPEHMRFFKEGLPITRQGGLGIGYVKPMAMATKTKIRPSPIHGHLPWQPKTLPAMLRPKDGIDPMDNAMWGYGLGGSHVPEWAFQAALETYLSLLSKSDPPLKGRQRCLTFEEAVQGVSGDEFAGPIDRSKSPGFPWAYRSKFKRLAFGEDDWTFDTPEAAEVKRVVEHDLALLRRGSRPFWLHQHFLKDERRSLTKVQAGMTRLISSSPLHAVIATRMLCLNFTSWMMHNRVRNGYGVGVNAHSPDWSLMAKMLGGDTGSFRVMCGDFKAWDKRLGAQTMTVIGHCMDLFYADAGSDDSKARWTIVADLQASRHIDGAIVYEWNASNPSGNALTTPANSTGNEVDTRAAFIIALVKKGVSLAVAKAAVASDHFFIIVYGDDLAVAVRKGTVFDLLQGEDIRDAFASMGLTYTDANKGGVAQFETIHEATFLKRSFKQTHHTDKRWMAPLAWETIVESVQWCREGKTTLEDWRRNVRSMALEASAHGREAYDGYVVAVQQAIRQLTEPPIIHFPSWRDAQDELLQTEFTF